MEGWIAFGIPNRPRCSGASSGRFPWNLDALLPSVALDRMTIERLMLARVAAGAAVPRLAAKS